MKLRRLLASLRGRRDRKKSVEIGQIDHQVEPVEASDDNNPRVRLILEDGHSVPLRDSERLEYLAENLLRAHERRHD